MTKNQENFKKLKKLNIEDINNKIIQLKKDIILLKIKQKTKEKIQCHLFKEKKNEIKQLITIKHLYLN